MMEEKIKTYKNDKNKAAMIENLNFYKLQVNTRVGLILNKDMNVVKKCKKEERV